MAIVTAVNRPRGQTRGGLRAVLRYVMKEEKTADQDRHLVTGVNCQADSCCTEFISTKLQYGKDGGRMYYHFVQSFHPEEAVTPELAHRIALELAQQWKDYEVVVATHTDRAHIHSHFIVNSVSFQSGRKLHFEKADLTQLRQFSDTLCMRYGLSVCQPKRQQTVARPTQAEYKIAARGQSWKVRLAMQINEAMKYAVSREQFLELMESEGYTVRWSESRKSITYTTPDGYRCRDCKLHDMKYLKGAMEDEFRIREKLFAHGRAAGHAAKRAPGEFEQGIQYPESRHTDGGQLDGSDPRYGADGERHPQGPGDAGASPHRAGDGNATGRAGWQSHGGAHRSGAADPADRTGAAGNQQREPAVDAGRNAGDPRRQPAGEREAAEGIPVTGWEDQRNILLASFQGRGYAARVRQLYQMEDVHPHHHPGAVGIGAASVAAGMSLLEDSSDDPEERRRQMEAREAAQNLGAVIGLAAGAVGAAARQHRKEPSKPDEPQMKQTPG